MSEEELTEEEKAEREAAYQEFVMNLYKHMGSKFPPPDEMYKMMDRKDTAKELGFDATVSIKRRFSAINAVYLYNCGIILDRISNQLATELNQNEKIIQQNNEITAMLRKYLMDQHAAKVEKETTKKKETSKTQKEG